MKHIYNTGWLVMRFLGSIVLISLVFFTIHGCAPMGEDYKAAMSLAKALYPANSTNEFLRKYPNSIHAPQASVYAAYYSKDLAGLKGSLDNYPNASGTMKESRDFFIANLEDTLGAYKTFKRKNPYASRPVRNKIHAKIAQLEIDSKSEGLDNRQVRSFGAGKLGSVSHLNHVPNNKIYTKPSNEKSKYDFVFVNSKVNNIDSIAIVIGNRNYQKGTPSVDYAHNDADQIKLYLIKALGYREGNIIDLRDATQADLVSVFGNEKSHKAKLFNWLRPNESDVFIYYSGHGAPGLSNGQGYLLPVDGDPATVEFNGYPLEALYANLDKLPAKSVTVVIDACFSGGSQAGAVVKSASSISLRVVEPKSVLPNATILTAAGISEVASWDEEAQLGLFTKHFLEGVTGKADQNRFGNGDGKVTLGELKNYLESEVSYMARRYYNRDQHPQVNGRAGKVLAVTN